MKITAFSVSNFRSITSAHKINISEHSTVLIGKNNEGKSNLLKALQVAMELLQSFGIRRSIYHNRLYVWERDFPIQLQTRKRPTQTIFRIDFSLDSNEIEEFKKRIGVSLNGTLPIEIRLGKDNTPVINVRKPGKNTTSLAKKISDIAKFVAEKISFNYIPAIRTDKEATEVVHKMLSEELIILESNTEYIRALDSIERLQKPILDKLAQQIQQPLSEFLPSIKGVSIEISEERRRFSLRRDIDIVIDDGIPTSIEYKGDGVKSLAALGLLKNKHKEQTGASIIAIEEPESHLHPGAIHQINDIILTLSETNQVILTTHNPLFVNRGDIKTNIIVNDGKAMVAKNISNIREILGIKASDNLTHANYALVVEGEEDVKILKAVLPALSDIVSKALKNNFLIIEPIGGAGNLSYKLSLLKNYLCTSHVYLDHDDAARKAFQRAIQDSLLKESNYTMSICNGMTDSEIEDCLDISSYKDHIMEKFGVDLTDSSFKGNKKWSERIRNTFLTSGKQFSDSTLKAVKFETAEAVSKKPASCLNQHKRSSIDALVKALERMLININ